MLPDFVTQPPGIARLLQDGGVPRLIDDLAGGLTFSDVAKRLGMTRGTLRKWVASLPHDTQQAILAADGQGASAMVEESKQIADDTAADIRQMTKPMYVDGQYVTDLVDANAILAAEKVRIHVRQWMAERKDKETWGAKSQNDITINLSAVHLDVLRRRNSGQPSPYAREVDAPATLTISDSASLPDVSDFL